MGLNARADAKKNEENIGQGHAITLQCMNPCKGENISHLHVIIVCTTEIIRDGA